MKHLSKIAAILAGVVGLSVGYAAGQQEQTETQNLITRTLGRGGEGKGQRVSDELQKVARDPQLTKQVAALALDWDKRAAPTETMLSTLQIQQNARIIEQNDRIIQLLEQQVQDKK